MHNESINPLLEDIKLASVKFVFELCG